LGMVISPSHRCRNTQFAMLFQTVILFVRHFGLVYRTLKIKLGIHRQTTGVNKY
jgi:hypothetical protein